MREAGRLPSEERARAFSDYLLTEGVESRVEADDGAWVIWVIDDDELERVRRDLDVFLHEPSAPRFSGRGERASAIRRRVEAESSRARGLEVDMRKRWQRSMGFAGSARGPVTTALIAISILVAVLTGLGDRLDPVGDWLTISVFERQGNYVTWNGFLREVQRGQVWRLVTPIFLHFGILHILFNMMWLYQLGNMVEAVRGSLFLVVLVLATAIPSNIAQFMHGGPDFGGMSGVVYGLLGYVWVKGRYDPGSGLGVHPSTMIFMMVWFALGFVAPLDTANFAHAGGLVCGLAFGGVPIMLGRRGPRR